MLQHLYIRNYILIEELEVDFMAGFSVVTGETGAGKSIFLGALNLLMGERLSGNLLKDATKKAVFEAVFNVEHYHLEHLFEELDVDFETQTIIRREILPSGKSRAFINDTPVSLGNLKQITHHLIDIHSQHENLLLGDSEFRFSLLDAVAETTDLLETYRQTRIRYKTLEDELEKLKEQALQSEKERDFLQYQFDQLDEASLQPNEYQKLENSIEALSHYEDIKQALSQSVTLLNEQDDDLPMQINRLAEMLQSISPYFEEADAWYERLSQVSVELQDIADEIFRKNDSLEYNPAELEMQRERLDLLNRLMQKTGVSTYEDLLAEKNQIESRLQEMDSFDSRIADQKAELQKTHAILHQQATSLSAKRKKAIPALSKKIENLIRQLGMPKARFEIALTAHSDEYSLFGIDSLRFLFSADAQKTPEDVSKIASGGELSRIMLAVKSILAQKKNLPTLIFDEIDTGVSGEIAARMATIMHAMATHMQLIAITHLPQITAAGQHHYLVEKTDSKNVVQTTVRLLSNDERIREVAKMLSNGQITESMLQNAKELLFSATNIN